MITRYLATVLSLALACVLHAGAATAASAPVPLFDPNAQPTGWVGEVDVTTYSFANGGYMFKTDFEKVNWSGNVWAYPVDANGTVMTAADIWSGGAADNIDAQNYDTGRVIITMKKDGSKIPFRWASLDGTQQSKLGDNTNGPKVLNFIRGDRSNEAPAGTLRSRVSTLGDIIHARPLYIDGDNPRVYVGANDGMLHALDANDGSEVFAYVPSMLIPNLKTLTLSPYSHQYFVDGTPNAARVNISGSKKTILVGGLGAGGQGLYALDITDTTPTTESATAAKLLWEITPTTINNTGDTSYADLGYTYGVPLIAKLNTGGYGVIVGNGYNSKNGLAVLYVIDLMTGAKLAALSTTKVTGSDNGNPNGLSSPAAVDVDGDGAVDYVYAGDITGNMWKFDLRSSSAGSWSAGFKLFAGPTAPSTQAITGAPAIALHPSGGRMILFGTGRIFSESGCSYSASTPTCDRTDTTQQYAYGLWDQDFPAAGVALSKTIDSTKLVSQSLSSPTTYTSPGVSATVRTNTSINAVDYTSGTNQKQGWRLALSSNGERVVGDGGFVSDQRFHFATTTPNYSNGSGNPLGDNWVVEVNYLTGVAPDSPFYDMNLDGQLTDDDRVKSGGKLVVTQDGIPVSRRIVAGGVISQPLLASLSVQAQTYFNMNMDATIAPATPSSDPGVAGGHFDYDIYYTVCSLASGSYKCPRNTHVHQYDDKYNVTGVNMLAPSLAAFNIANPIPSTSTGFKILMANQMYSPAVQIKVGGVGASWTPVYSFLTSATDKSNLSAGTFSSSLPIYHRNPTDLQYFVINMPVDAFTQKAWDGNPAHSFVGLIPTTTGCVHSNKGAPAGLWMNGALTIQVIKDTTPDSAIELNDKVGGNPAFGFRLKTDSSSAANQLAQYTIFWHHPNGKCYGDAGWGNTSAIAYADKPGNSTSQTPATGSSDPSGGTFGSGSGGTGTGSVSGSGTGSGTSGTNSTTSTVTLGDGSTVTQTITRNADGTITVTVTDSTGASTTYTLPPTTGGRQKDSRIKSGRLSWKQLIKP